MLENELRQAMADCACAYEVVWMASGLHETPKKLKLALQEALDTHRGYRRALMAYGSCGLALAGIQSRDMTLVVPRVDDCISLLLGSSERRRSLQKEPGTYFLTEGWLKGERSIWREYEAILAKYGEDTGRYLIDKIYGGYTTLAMLDTGCYDLPRAEREAKRIAEALRKGYTVLPATIGYLKKLLTGPWDQTSFLTVAPGGTIRESDLTG